VPVSLKRKLADLSELGSAGGEAARNGIRRALTDANAFVVGTAAALAARRSFDDLVPELLAAYDRLFDPTPDEPDLSLDPLAGGKRAIVAALVDLGYREPEPFLRGLDHVQHEPVYRGKVDVARELRCACAEALVGCFIDPDLLLERLVDRAVDPETIVRLAAVRALGAIGGRASSLLLRLKALGGDDEPEVTGECLRALLAMHGDGAIPFVARFTQTASEAVRLEAASALAESREPAAFTAMRTVWDDPSALHLRRGIVVALGASPLPEAAEFLLELVAEGPRELALQALEALGTSRFVNEMRERAEHAVLERADVALNRVFVTAFTPSMPL
jgi:HEAT repeat protein